MGKPLDNRQKMCYTVIEQRDCVTLRYTAIKTIHDKFDSYIVFFGNPHGAGTVS